MHDELIKRLRDAAKISEALVVLLPQSEGDATAKLYNEAANAIEELNRKVEDFESMREISPEAEYAINKHADNLISRLDKLISGLEDKPHWIPVTERLPEKDVWVLRYSAIMDAIWLAYLNSAGVWMDELGEVPDVTHWMPIAPPMELPKEE